MALFTGAMLLLKARSIGGFLAKNWQAALIVLLLVGIVGYHVHRTNIIEGLEDDIVELKADKAAIELSLANCNGAINNQNGIIDTLKQTGADILKEERKRAAVKIAELEAKRKASIESLKNKPIAQSCEAAMKELLDFAKGEGK